MATEGQRDGLERLAAGQTVAMALAIHAALTTWIEFWSPSTTGPGVLSAVAWAAAEHPGRCAIAATLAGWSLWKPHPGGNVRQPSPSVDPGAGSVDPDAGVDDPIEL